MEDCSLEVEEEDLVERLMLEAQLKDTAIQKASSLIASLTQQNNQLKHEIESINNKWENKLSHFQLEYENALRTLNDELQKKEAIIIQLNQKVREHEKNNFNGKYGNLNKVIESHYKKQHDEPLTATPQKRSISQATAKKRAQTPSCEIKNLTARPPEVVKVLTEEVGWLRRRLQEKDTDLFLLAKHNISIDASSAGNSSKLLHNDKRKKRLETLSTAHPLTNFSYEKTQLSSPNPKYKYYLQSCLGV